MAGVIAIVPGSRTFNTSREPETASPTGRQVQGNIRGGILTNTLDIEGSIGATLAPAPPGASREPERPRTRGDSIELDGGVE
jgi:hypothetical protein